MCTTIKFKKKLHIMGKVIFKNDTLIQNTDGTYNLDMVFKNQLYHVSVSQRIGNRLKAEFAKGAKTYDINAYYYELVNKNDLVIQFLSCMDNIKIKHSVSEPITLVDDIPIPF